MAERQTRCQVRFEYCFDRLFEAKLEQVYDILVPDCTCRTGGARQIGGHGDEDSGDLRKSVVRPAKAGQDNSELDGYADSIRFKPRLQRTG